MAPSRDGKAASPIISATGGGNFRTVSNWDDRKYKFAEISSMKAFLTVMLAANAKRGAWAFFGVVGMLLKKITIGLASAIALVAATPAAATAIVVGQWYAFGFAGVGSTLASGGSVTPGTNPASIAAPEGPWTFTLTETGALTVVDGFLSGDRFAITDFGSAIGNTSVPVGDAGCGSDITLCLSSPSISKGVFALASGNHSISGTVLSSPFSSGGAFFRVAAVAGAVPEPGTWAMMLVGFGLVGASVRRRNAVAVRFA
ncbi:MAG: PEPxxWA-CTERM sorting domain-containing protein [Sphingomicrobium sp.]